MKFRKLIGYGLVEEFPKCCKVNIRVGANVYDALSEIHGFVSADCLSVCLKFNVAAADVMHGYCAKENPACSQHMFRPHCPKIGTLVI